MRRLMLLRHAKTETDAPSGRDQDRRLDDRGRKDAARIGKWIAAHPAVTCAIPATSQLPHLRQNMEALSGALPDAALRRRIAALSRQHTATGRYSGQHGAGTALASIAA